MLMELIYFNTSYVSVLLPISISPGIGVYRFQYILCIGFTDKVLPVVGRWPGFQYILCIGFTFLDFLSFFDVLQFQYILCIGFTPTCVLHVDLTYIFQYILCIGFTYIFQFFYFL